MNTDIIAFHMLIQNVGLRGSSSEKRRNGAWRGCLKMALKPYISGSRMNNLISRCCISRFSPVPSRLHKNFTGFYYSILRPTAHGYRRIAHVPWSISCISRIPTCSDAGHAAMVYTFEHPHYFQYQNSDFIMQTIHSFPSRACPVSDSSFPIYQRRVMHQAFVMLPRIEALLLHLLFAVVTVPFR